MPSLLVDIQLQGSSNNPKARPADSLDFNPCVVIILPKVVIVTQISEPCATLRQKRKKEEEAKIQQQSPQLNLSKQWGYNCVPDWI